MVDLVYGVVAAAIWLKKEFLTFWPSRSTAVMTMIESDPAMIAYSMAVVPLVSRAKRVR
jgi:hypothetical protein